MLRTTLRVILVTVFPIFLFSQEVGKIAGTVTDEATGEALVGANVLVEGTSFGTATGTDGRYTILAISVGTYVVRVEYIGYRPVRLSNVQVHKRLTTEANFAMSSETLELGMVEVVAERPLIVKNATNSTRIVDGEIINKIAIRGVENLIAIQAGAVSSRGDVYVRGGRMGDISYYVDGVYTVDPWGLDNPIVVSNRAMEEIAFQAGGFDAEFGNSNGGMVSTVTRTGGENFDISAEFVTGLGSADAGTEKDDLRSYGYQLYNVNFGGPVGDRIRFFGSFEQLHQDDQDPSVTWYAKADRRTSASLGGFGFDSIAVSDPDFLAFAYDQSADGVWGPEGSDEIDNDNDGVTDEDDEGWNTGIANVERLTRVVYGAAGADTTYYLTAFDNHRRLYGPRDNAGYDRNAISANLVVDLKPLRIKLGGNFTTDSYSSFFNGGPDPDLMNLANSEYLPLRESQTIATYANFTYSLGANSYVKFNANYWNTTRELMDSRHKDNILDYGDPSVAGNEWLRAYGENPIGLARFVNQVAYGAVYNEYRLRNMSYVGFSGDFVNQLGNHEIKAGATYRGHTVRDYILSQPMEI
ncbi:MAG: carboxypeptidase-like regulatory domain-containing protein, partial [Candidatus Neomarinimicrobiota bacterium]